MWTCYGVNISHVGNPEKIDIYNRNADKVSMPPAQPMSAAMSVYSGLVFNKIYRLAMATTATQSIYVFLR